MPDRTGGAAPERFRRDASSGTLRSTQVVDISPVGMLRGREKNRWHSHHNTGDSVAWVLPIQDAGLYTHQRTLDIRFESSGHLLVNADNRGTLSRPVHFAVSWKNTHATHIRARARAQHTLVLCTHTCNIALIRIAHYVRRYSHCIHTRAAFVHVVVNLMHASTHTHMHTYVRRCMPPPVHFAGSWKKRQGG